MGTLVSGVTFFVRKCQQSMIKSNKGGGVVFMDDPLFFTFNKHHSNIDNLRIHRRNSGHSVLRHGLTAAEAAARLLMSLITLHVSCLSGCSD